ncbi:Carnitine O-acetyltransferase mitochondrial [Spathaspora sp. JA1]|nr:Carnitine O-acetyltransferase mitochondrial [Spathaspora sp. JA1]
MIKVRAQLVSVATKSTPASKFIMPILATKRFQSSKPKGDLYKFQSQLPKLPVPALKDTAAKYLKSVEPFLSPAQLAETTAKVEDFVKSGGVGETLQARLTEFAKGKDNWLAEFWDDYAYMSYRDPVVPYVSYFFSHKDIRGVVGENQLVKASLLAYYTIEFMEQVQSEQLPAEVIKGNPFCMNAFRYMFNNSRVPAPGSDITKHYDAEANRFFIVIYQNNFYKVPTHDSKGKKLNKGEIYQYLQQIKNDSTAPGIGLGALTSLNRDEWLAAYNNLRKSPVNEASLETIFASAFVICLDSYNPITVEEKSRNCWHGDGQNRFFDKPLQFFVGTNGNSGFLGEHSRMDATPTVQLNNTVYKQIVAEAENKNLIEEIATFLPRVGKAEQIHFDIDPIARGNIIEAIVKFENTISAHDEEIFQYYGHGKNLIKKFKTSPDAYVQMMMQLAYYKLTGKVRPTYESAATRKYLKGRTETGRTVSNESKKFVETWTNPTATIADKVATFQAACKQHVSYLSAAADGQGVDRHFFGLKNMLAQGEAVPEIFTDPIFSYSSKWYISSSQIPSEYFQSWGWSQVVDDGFGLAYLINNEWIHVHISCKHGNGLSSDHMKWYLVESANEMKEVLTKGLLEGVEEKAKAKL